MIYYIILAIISILAFVFMNKTYGLTNLLNPFVVYFYMHFIFLFVGLFFIDYYTTHNIYISNTVTYMIIYGFITTMLGSLLTATIAKVMKVNILKINDISLDSKETSKLNLNILFLIWLTGIVLSLFFIYKSGHILLFETENIDNLRIELRKGMGAITLLSISLMSYGGLAILLHNSRVTFTFKVIIFFVTVVLLLNFGNRGPVLIFLLVFLFLYALKSKYKISINKIAVLGLIMYVLMVVTAVLRNDMTEHAFMDLFMYRFPWRPFVNIMNLQTVYDGFQNSNDFFSGYAYFIELETLLPGYSPNLGSYVKDLLGQEFSGGGMTLTYLGIAYIDFDIYGIIIFPFILGVFITLLSLKLQKKIISIEKSIFLFFMSFAVGAFVGAGIISPILYIAIPYALIFMGHKMLIYFLRTIVENSNFRH